MAEETVAEHTLALLREMRDTQNRDFAELKAGQQRMEIELHGILQTTGALLSMYGAQNETIDKLTRRVERIERRLELIDE